MDLFFLLGDFLLSTFGWKTFPRPRNVWSTSHPPPGGIGVSKLSMDTLRDASQAMNGQASLSSSPPVGMEAKAADESAAAGVLYRAANDLAKGKFKDSLVLMDRLKESLSYAMVMLSLVGYVPSAAWKRLAGYAALCLRIKIFVVPDQTIGTTSIKATCRVVRVTAVGDLDGLEILSAHLVAGPNHDFKLLKGLTFWEVSFVSCRRLVQLKFLIVYHMRRPENSQRYLRRSQPCQYWHVWLTLLKSGQFEKTHVCSVLSDESITIFPTDYPEQNIATRWRWLSTNQIAIHPCRYIYI